MAGWNSMDTKTSSGNSFWIGLLIAPASGLLLFVGTFLLIHYTQYQGYLTGISDGIILSFILLLTYGLVAAYVLVGVVGLPTAYLLQRKSTLNLFTINIAALCWTVAMLIGLRLLAFSANASAPITAEIATVLKGTFFIAPSVLFSATIFYWIVTKHSVIQFGLKLLLMLVTIFCASLSVASVIRSAIEPRAVVSVDHPNGTRLLVTQEFSVISEPFVTEIFFDDGDGNWRWYYYDHEDTYWGSADYEIAGSEIHISSGKRKIQIDTLTGECTVSNVDGQTRTHGKSTKMDSLPPTLGNSTDS
jgi:hypothetical protein